MATTAPQTTIPATTTTATTSVSANFGFEVARYVLYFLDFIFGVLTWGVVADKLFVTKFAGLIFDNTTCIAFGSKIREHPTDIGRYEVRSSKLCSVIIGLGVIMMIALIVNITLHTLGLFRRQLLSLKAEGINFAIMSLLWFILGIAALATSTSGERKGTDGVNAAIAGGWLAGLSHAASTAIAFLQLRMTGGKADELPKTTQTPSPQSAQPYTTPQQAYTPPQPVMSQPMGTPQQYAPAPHPTPQHNYAQQPAMTPVQPAVPMQTAPVGQAPAAPPPPGHPQV